MLVVLAHSRWTLLSFASKASALTDKDTVVLADFANSTGDAIFDDTLKTALTVFSAAVAVSQSSFRRQGRRDSQADDSPG